MHDRGREIDCSARCFLLALSDPPDSAMSEAIRTVSSAGDVRIYLNASGWATAFNASHDTKDFVRLAERKEYWHQPESDGSPVQEEGRIYIDGHLYSLHYIYTNLFDQGGGALRRVLSDLGTRIEYTPVDGQDDRVLQHKSFTLWAEEVLLRIISRRDNPHGALAGEVVRGRFRTRQAVLDDIRLTPLAGCM